MSFLAAVGIITWQELRQFHRAPRPERFLYVAVVWGLLGVVSEVGGDDIAAVFSVGLVLTLLYSYYNNTPAVKATQANPVQQNQTQAEAHANQIGA